MTRAKELKSAHRKQTVSDYRDRFEAAKSARQDFETTWRLCYDAYRGEIRGLRYSTVYPDDASGTVGRRFGTHPEINDAKTVVDTMFAASSTRVPKINVFPRRERLEESARILEVLINYWWGTWGAHDAFQLAQKDSIIIGHGWVKLVWQLAEDQRKLTSEEREARIQAAISEQADVPGGGVREEYIRDFLSQHSNNLVTVLHNEYPQAVYVSPWDMFIDPQAEHIDSARWVAQRFREPYYIASRNPKYNPRARKKLNISDVNSADESRGSFWRQARALDGGTASGVGSLRDEMVELVEFHDLEAGTWCVFELDGDGDDFLIEPRDSPFHGSPYRSPFEMIRNHEEGRIYPHGDVVHLIPLFWEQNEIRTQSMLHRQQLNNKFLADKGKLDETVIAQLQSNSPGTVVQIARPVGEPLENVVQPLRQPSMPNDFAQSAQVVQNDIERISGVTEVAMGTAQVSRRSATEARILEAASTGRASLKMERAQRAAARVGGRMVIMAQTFLSGEEVVEIVGPEGQHEWVAFDRKAIQGMFGYEVEHGSMAPRGDVAKREDAAALAQLLVPLLGYNVIRPWPLVKLILRAWGVENVEEYNLTEEEQTGIIDQFNSQPGLPPQSAPPPLQ